MAQHPIIRPGTIVQIRFGISEDFIDPAKPALWSTYTPFRGIHMPPTIFDGAIAEALSQFDNGNVSVRLLATDIVATFRNIKF